MRLFPLGPPAIPVHRGRQPQFAPKMSRVFPHRSENFVGHLQRHGRHAALLNQSLPARIAAGTRAARPGLIRCFSAVQVGRRITPAGRRWPQVARKPAAQRGPGSPGAVFQRSSPQRPRQVACHPPPRQPPPAACWYNAWYNASRDGLQLVYLLDLELHHHCFPSWMPREMVPATKSG